MAQRLSQLPSEAIPYAQEALPYSSLNRGLGAMNPSNIGMSNMQDGGAFSKPYANAQDQRNQELRLQNMQQNALSAGPQAAANAMGQVRKNIAEQSDAQSHAQQFANANIADTIEAAGGGQGLMRLNAKMQGPERESFVNDIAVSRAMGATKAGELGQLQAEANRYA